MLSSTKRINEDNFKNKNSIEFGYWQEVRVKPHKNKEWQRFDLNWRNQMVRVLIYVEQCSNL
ncbi:MAG: hypothetical protein K0R31_854 [Clostridiales bacterium]|jgi:hypothetical protein|nr:hypothetical protein [Clostridiales bacterium]